MELKKVPDWILALDEEDLEFIKRFVMNSGSLKEIAKIYEVSYPTVRIKLDRLIEKIKLNDAADNEEFVTFIKQLLIEDRKSTRLNSSHVKISYAVFCLKKKKKQ